MLILLTAILLTIAVVCNGLDVRRRLAAMQKEIDKLPMMRKTMQDLQIMQSRLFLMGVNGRLSNASLNEADRTPVGPAAPRAEQSDDDGPPSRPHEKIHALN
jgi:hypothetical protein